jgi:hypothetical protein
MIHHLRHRGTRRRASSGALAAVLVRSTDVCLSPDSGGIADIPQPPLGANNVGTARLPNYFACAGKSLGVESLTISECS